MRRLITLNESPSEKEGKSHATHHRSLLRSSLNESPSEKEGKLDTGYWALMVALHPQ